MNNKIRQLGLIVFVLAVIFFVLVPTITRIFEGERGRLKRIIYSAKKATERENLLKCSSFVSFKYNDSYGNDRESLLFIAKNIFNNYNDITLAIRDLEIKVQDKDAMAEFELMCIAQSQYTSEIEYDTIKLKVIFKKEIDGWKVIELVFSEPERNPYFQNIS